MEKAQMKQPNPQQTVKNLRKKLSEIDTNKVKMAFITTWHYEPVQVGFVYGVFFCALMLMIFSYFFMGWKLYIAVPVLIIMSEFIGRWRENYKKVI